MNERSDMPLKPDTGADTRCSFCGKSPQDVHTILTSRESAICDECVVAALDTVSRVISSCALPFSSFGMSHHSIVYFDWDQGCRAHDFGSALDSSGAARHDLLHL